MINFANHKIRIMKKNILVLFIAFFSLMVANAQITYDKDTAILVMENGVAHKATIKLTNNSGYDISLRWKMLSSTLNDNNDGDSDNSNNWAIQFCECNTCYTNDFNELPNAAQCADPMGHVSGANSQDWYLTVDPNGQPIVDGEWVIEVTNLTDNIVDTLVYLAVSPNAVKKVNFNANVTSYPNPAKDQLTINYELTQVNSPVLTVYNLVGSKIARFPLNGQSGRLDVNTGAFQTGMYFYAIEENGQQIFIQKFNVVH